MPQRPKVVPITAARRNLRAAIEIPDAVARAIRILASHRAPAQISFFVPPLAPDFSPTTVTSGRGKLLLFPSQAVESKKD